MQLARRDKYAIPPSPKPQARKDKTRAHRLESKDSVGTIGSALDVREFRGSDVVSANTSKESFSPSGSEADFGGEVRTLHTKDIMSLTLSDGEEVDEEDSEEE